MLKSGVHVKEVHCFWAVSSLETVARVGYLWQGRSLRRLPATLLEENPDSNPEGTHSIGLHQLLGLLERAKAAFLFDSVESS